LALAVVTLAVFLPVTGFKFVNYDDPDFVTANPHVQAGLAAESFRWAWRSDVAHNWHPITMLTHMLDCQWFGLRPWWPHLVNVLLHTANALLLFALLARMTGALWRSAAVAALFAWHPLHVESVAWIAERKDLLSTFFWFLTIWAYLRYAEELKVRHSKFRVFYALSFFFFALGLMSKPMLVTVPFSLLLLDYWPLGRMKSVAQAVRLAGEKIPFFLGSAALCVVTYRIQQQGGAVLPTQAFPLESRLANALASYVRYIEMMFWPRHLAGLYLRSGQWPWWGLALAGLLLLAISALVLAQARRRPYLAVGWFWYVGTLVPVIGLVQVGMQSMADHYTYVPLVGLFIILAWGGAELAATWSWTRFAPAATAAALAGCAVLTMHQEFYWKDSETLFKRMIDSTPNNYIAHYDLGNFYYREGRTAEAISNFTAAVEEEPQYAEAHNNLGCIFLAQKRYDEALQHYRAAVRVQPTYLYYFNLANALADMASAHRDTNEFAEAVQTYQHALRLNPASREAHYNLGLTWQAQGRAREAAAEFEQAASLGPNRADAHK
jgi:tetratricopeptide (TPR) repeat protein